MRADTKKAPNGAFCLMQKDVAEWTGLEPATLDVTGRYSNQLNYHSVSPIFLNRSLFREARSL